MNLVSDTLNSINELESWEVRILQEFIDHEYWHSQFYSKFGIHNEIEISLERFKEGTRRHLDIMGKCYGLYSKKYNSIKYYFKYILIEFIQFFYDIIDDFFRFPKFFNTFFHRLKFLLNSLKSFRNK